MEEEGKRLQRVLRSLLFVPANSWRMIETALGEGEDAVILDIEDGCPLDEKETGRIFARDAIPRIRKKKIEVFVRVNSLETGMTKEDIEYVVQEELTGIMLPKTEEAEDILAVESLLSETEKKRGISSGKVAILPLIETPRGVLNVNEIIRASSRVIGISFGAGDYSREIGAGMGVTSLSKDEYWLMAYHPRSVISLAARAAGVLAIDAPYFGLIIDVEGLREETKKIKLMGFTGKLLTHPRHIEPVNQVFTPSEDEVTFARKVIEVYEEARNRGLGATSIGGRMIDYGSYKRALSVIAIAERIAEKYSHD
jgi:citrate lyase subunit beta/citryl-CoA lyase